MAAACSLLVAVSVLGSCVVRVTPAGTRLAWVGDDLVVDVPAGSSGE
ncbi:MAG: hypothetical protein RI900_1497, partial [Actinomycetota bacterium]